MLAGAVITALLVSACGQQQAKQLPVTGTTRESRAVGTSTTLPGNWRHWIINAHTLKDLLKYDSTGIVTSTLDNPGTFLIISNDIGAPPGWSVTKTEAFTDADKLVVAVDGNELLPGVTAVLLDLEDWPITPDEQKRYPGAAYNRAAAAAHAHRFKLIATPAQDLVTAARRPGESLPDAFLRLGIASQVAKSADVIGLQSQATELDPETFTTELSAEAKQARAINPGVVVLGGISTNPSGREVSAQQMAAAARAAETAVQGFWLNDPAGGAYCPRCRGPFPDVAVRFLSLLASP